MLLQDNLNGVQHLGIPVVSIETAKAWYVQKLGFSVIHEPVLPTPAGDIRVAFLDKNGLVIECYQLVGDDLEEVRRRGHGHIDHFAIDVLDMDVALADVRRRGAQLNDATPDGPVLLPTFWARGAKYVFLTGPTHEKVELNQRLDLPFSRRADNLGGWSHLGIPVTDMDKALAFYEQLGFVPVMQTTVPVGEGAIRAAMLEKNNFLLEFYEVSASEIAPRDGHIDHIALDVTDIDAAFRELQAAGFAPLEDAPVTLPFWDKGIRYFNVRGPHGEKVEFNQKLV